MAITAKVIADSISEQGKRITTLQLKYQRFIHSEVMTHRVFSRNASSSRAIPVAKMIEQVRSDPAMPIHWGKNQAGMQAKEELDEYNKLGAKQKWLSAAEDAAKWAEALMNEGAHKQIVNRILEPFQWIHVVVTATEWGNFFELRAHEDAQPEIHELAIQMKAAMDASVPALLKSGEWHLPYVTDEDQVRIEQSLFGADIPEGIDIGVAIKNRAASVSAARCCRVSYLKHDQTAPSIEDDLALCERLAGARPIHASPFEHQATPMEDPTIWSGNFQGWRQYRKLIEQSFKN